MSFRYHDAHEMLTELLAGLQKDLETHTGDQKTIVCGKSSPQNCMHQVRSVSGHSVWFAKALRVSIRFQKRGHLSTALCKLIVNGDHIYRFGRLLWTYNSRFSVMEPWQRLWISSCFDPLSRRISIKIKWNYSELLVFWLIFSRGW